MDEVGSAPLWVEIVSRQGDVLARHRCSAPELRIGRGYANDVVLDDPYVAPEHLHIRRDAAGKWVAEDFGSANGLFAGHGKTKMPRIVLDGDQLIRIGRTYLRVRDPAYSVPRERLEDAQVRVWPVAIALGCGALAFELLLLWLGETREPHLYRYVESLAGLAFPLAGWAGIWAVLARVFSGEARFGRQLLIALWGLLFWLIGYELIKLIAFSFTWRWLAAYQYVGGWCLAAAVCFAHLNEVAPSRAKLNAAIMAALAAGAIAMHVLVQIEQRSATDQRIFATSLMPPVLQLAPPVREDAFFAEVERLKSAVDHARIADPP